MTGSIDTSSAAYIHPSTLMYGDVTVGEGASLWPHVVIRAEMHAVRIGRFSNVQDFVMVHVGWDTPTVVGDYCSITHHVTLHGCTIGDNCLIGINATVMDGAVIGDNTIVAGHTFIREGSVIPANAVVMGTPGRVVATRNNFVANRVNAMLYHRNAVAYAHGDHRAWSGPDFEAFLAAQRSRFEAEFADQFTPPS
ncbi:MAG: gamma carbonic anhydrase family protein [Rhodospirillales bacterium]|nr:gamma carbonic anhydrase family protein [Rhodospirillales bacterium]